MFRSRRFLPISIAAVLALALGGAISIVLFVSLRQLERDKLELDFQRQAQDRIVAVSGEMEAAVQLVRLLNQLFATVEPVTREQFNVFSQPLLARSPYIQALNFHRFITDEQRADFEARIRALVPDYRMQQMVNGQVVLAPRQERHLVVDYIEPMAGNEAALGLDVTAHKQMMQVVQRAVDTGQPSSTAMLKLAQGRRGFVVLMPVYRHGASLTDVESRRKAAIGDTAAVFAAEELVRKILGTSGLLMDDGIGVSVYAAQEPDESQLVFRSAAARQKEAGTPRMSHWLFYDQPKSVTRNFDVAGTAWRMEVSASPRPFLARGNASLYGLAGGILLSLVAAAYLQALATRSRRVQQLVKQRTAELRLANQLLTEDIVARRRVEEALRLRERAIEASTNAIIITSAQPPLYPIEYVNPAFERITGHAAHEVIGRNSSLLWADDIDQPGIQEVAAATREQREGHALLRGYTRDGRMFWCDIYMAPVRDAAGMVTHYVAALYDITATRRYQAELEFQANRDTLTGLANRNLLRDRVQQALAYADRYDHPVWVVYINLDRFKFVNDTLGHKAGDTLLKVVAERLQHAVRETDTAARLAGDEFVLVLPERAQEALAPAVIQRIMEAVAQPIVIDGYKFITGCSIGIAVCPTDGDDPETLIKHAGVAMYRAKELGRNNFQFYTPSMNEHAMERLRIEGDLRNALEREEFVLHYQPQIDATSGRVVGVEALIRWQHPELGMLSPARFIDLAEETGLIVPIGAWVLRTACRQNAAWQQAGFPPLRMAVNLSARQFFREDLTASVADVLEETKLAPHFLELELTESMMMADVEDAVDIMAKLKALGVHLSIDDFGTGYSSLSRLKRFPIDLLKIDQSFVRDIARDADDTAIVLSIISLARSLNMKVIAEGVETEEQAAYLRQHGCDYMQGYYFGRPAGVGKFEACLKKTDGRVLS